MSRPAKERGEVQPIIAEAAKNLGVTPEYFLQADTSYCALITMPISDAVSARR